MAGSHKEEQSAGSRKARQEHEEERRRAKLGGHALFRSGWA